MINRIFISFSLLLMLSSCTTAQKLALNNNDVLKSFIEDSVICRYVLPHCRTECETIFVVDTSAYFKPFEGDAKIKLENSLLYSSTPKTKEAYEHWHCRILISKLETKGKVSTIYYFSPITNGSGFISYKIVKSKLRKIKSQYGQF